MSANGKPLDLQDPVVLYANRQKESLRAMRLLDEAGIVPFITKGPVEPSQRLPLLVHCGAVHQGLDGITMWLDLLRAWADHLPTSGVFRANGASARS